jgi:hypothetical protein
MSELQNVSARIALPDGRSDLAIVGIDEALRVAQHAHHVVVRAKTQTLGGNKPFRREDVEHSELRAPWTRNGVGPLQGVHRNG